MIVRENNSGCIKGALIGLVVLVLLAGGCGLVVLIGAGEAVKELDRQMGTASESDYVLTAVTCAPGEFTGPEASGTITNTSDEQQAFHLTVRFTGPDGSLVSEDPHFTDPIDPGQAAPFTVTSFEPGAPPDSTCEVVKVEYTIFDNQNDR